MSGSGGELASSVAVPAYFPPGAVYWTDLADPRLGAVVLNVDSGAGTARDSGFADVAHRTSAAGVRLAGYVDTAYGRRPPAEIAEEVRRYRLWYGVRAVFLDQVSAVPEHVLRYRRIVAGVRARGAEHVVFNHGAYPDALYAQLADLLVTFEGPWSAYRHVRAPAWATRLPAERFCHLVYAAPRSVLPRALARARRCNAGVVYITDRTGANPWNGLPEYFSRELSLVYAGD
ncbi:spherulation-specific family 4 protein [Actinomadura luteofluorescens]|uniref:spherulation-specific family 4 protein n=1 Tax=Actinomadura luteofluorescens TaxID=46163 RepID=UPI003482464F